MGGGDSSRRGMINPGTTDLQMLQIPQATNDAMAANPDRETRKPEGEKKIYNKKDLEALIDALRRIGINELTTPPEFLGRRHQPVNYVLPMYPPNRLPEDVIPSF